MQLAICVSKFASGHGFHGSQSLQLCVYIRHTATNDEPCWQRCLVKQVVTVQLYRQWGADACVWMRARMLPKFPLCGMYVGFAGNGVLLGIEMLRGVIGLLGTPRPMKNTVEQTKQ